MTVVLEHGTLQQVSYKPVCFQASEEELSVVVSKKLPGKNER